MMPVRLRIGGLSLGLALALVAGCASNAVPPPEPATVSPGRAQELAREGRQAYEQGRKAAARKAWREAVELNPADPVTVNNLALLLKEEHRFREAASLLENGLEQSPEVPELHYNLAVIAELYLLDLEKALAHYQQYRELAGQQDKRVAGWIADLQRRLD